MNSSLDSIWDEDIAEQPASTSSPKHSKGNDSDEDALRLSKRPRQTLFLADSDDDEGFTANHSTRQTQKAPLQQDLEMEAFFAEVENDDDDPFSFKPLAPAVDEEEIRRQAEARHRRTVPTLTPHQILPSSSPPQDVNSSKNDDERGNGKEKDDKKKEKRKPIRLDEGRLLGPNGFPQLIKDTKNFRIKGKGHESTDLNRLLQVYQFWSHRMYPKTQFRDTVERVEKFCHSKRMNVALSVWRDEAHGKKPAEEEKDEDLIDLTNNDETRSAPSASESDAVEYTPSSPAPSRPPTSASEFEDDDFDIDAIIAEQERLKKGSDILAATAPAPASTVTAVAAAGVTKPLDPPRQNTAEDEDDAMWSMFNDVDDPPPISKHPPASVIPKRIDTDEDEDMWDVIQEIEDESRGKASLPTNSPTTTAAPVLPAPVNSTADMEEYTGEDLYT
ncbi:replication fork protection component Swi3-domain-containing protein [Crucibulum laeve]|uniref:Chromosome segregation in meiosis protein n=1 Tax=Crucibulum laeve TaxID=68775 RepID=A0A5C3MDP9_9AGAR|nr:replication fork protection component Swi3-domain-containing protein [Crucibulum laeve]